MDEIDLRYAFGPGFVQNRTTCRVISQFEELANFGSASSALMMWNGRTRRWHHYTLGWTAIRIACTEKQMFALSASGQVLRANARGVKEEQIEAQTAVGQFKDLRDLTVIGDRVYAAGRGGCVYRDDNADRWVDLQADETTDRDLAVNAISGTSGSHIIAVGDKGHIWAFDGQGFERVESPTTVDLSAVVVSPQGESAIAAGNDGVVLRLDDSGWHTAHQDPSKGTLTGLTLFKNRCYAASPSAIYALNDRDELELIDVAHAPGWTFGYLHSNDGIMWSFGKRHLFWTEDGQTWHNQTPDMTPFDPSETGPAVSRSRSCGCTGGGHMCGG
ncbi:MAG: hypothetical protein QNJ97_08755 [Myxococcota bacterium]|nr:hypothetical protein [Myxococcota bacterium]